MRAQVLTVQDAGRGSAVLMNLRESRPHSRNQETPKPQCPGFRRSRRMFKLQTRQLAWPALAGTLDRSVPGRWHDSCEGRLHAPGARARPGAPTGFSGRAGRGPTRPVRGAPPVCSWQLEEQEVCLLSQAVTGELGGFSCGPDAHLDSPRNFGPRRKDAGSLRSRSGCRSKHHTDSRHKHARTLGS